jgi:methylmalonyl-CoA mutase N-terminal domain/subunit
MDEIEQAAYEYTKSVDDGERVIVGVNRYTIDDEPEPVLLSVDPATQAGQVERVRGFKAERDHELVRARLDDVKTAAHGSANLLPPMRAALRDRATLGEVSDALRDVFGEYRPNR